MPKILFAVITAISILLSIFSTIPVLEAAKLPNQKEENTQIKYKDVKELLLDTQPLQINSTISNSNTLKKSKPKIINGELDIEPDVKMTKNQKQTFDKCKIEEKSRRNKRNKNKPTSCIKVPTQVNEELTDQDYTTLIDKIQEQKDVEDKKDLSKELALSEFINTDTIFSCNPNNSLSSISSIVASSALDNGCNETQISSSGLTNSSNISSSTLSSIQISSIPSQSSISEISSNISSQSKSTTLNKSSFLDFLFGGIKAEAAGIVSDGYRLPYPSGVKVKTQRVFNDISTHANHNALDLYSINNNNGSKYNENIVAAKSGTVFLSNASTSVSAGLGENIVIRQDDGNYALYAHLSSRSYGVGTNVIRGQKIGTQGDTGTYYSSFDNSHLHFEVLQPGILDYSSACKTEFNNCYNAFTIDSYKVIPQFDECFVSRGGLAEDEPDCKLNGINQGYPYKSYSSVYWTSINSPTPTITDPNITNVIPTQDAWWKALDEGCKTDEGSKVYIWDRNSENCQKMRYNAGNKTITNPWGKCMDAGDVNNSSNRWLRFSTCHNGANQQWLQEGEGGAGKGRIWSQAKTTAGETLCADFAGLNNGDSVNMNVCNNNQSQKFFYDIGITGQNVPSSNAGITDPNISTILPPQADWKKALDYGCKTADNSRVYMWDRGAGGNYWASNDCQKMRYNSNNYTITNPYGKCMDSGDSNSNRWIRFSTCNNGNNQKWLQESQSKGGRIWSFQKNSNNQVMCIEYYNLDNGTGLDVNPCNSSQTQKWYPDLNITNQDIPNTINYKMMRSYYNSGYGMNIYGGGSANQAQVKMYALTGTDNELMINNSNYELVFKNGKCLDGGDVNNSNNRWLRINDCSGNGNQKWFFDNYNRLVNYANQSLCVDSASGDSNGSLLYLYPCHSGNNQKWSLN